MHIVATIRHAKQRLPKQCNKETKEEVGNLLQIQPEKWRNMTVAHPAHLTNKDVYKEANKDYRESPEHYYYSGTLITYLSSKLKRYLPTLSKGKINDYSRLVYQTFTYALYQNPKKITHTLMIMISMFNKKMLNKDKIFEKGYNTKSTKRVELA